MHLGHPDAVFLAIREALRMAQEGDDELLHATLRASVSRQLLVQGRYEESEVGNSAGFDGVGPAKAVHGYAEPGHGYANAEHGYTEPGHAETARTPRVCPVFT
ncbi:MAG TPA: hypothetical protein VGR06_13040 [Actinophytocola sp.]|uniref:hypothetical protein n=1 Tax=Actinophytocola sp. TaxID=1872138 RepID=UPI002DFD1AC4|nr:hypothetical protein [Actinophytocola sp.]